MKKSHLIEILGHVSAALTVLAAIPYELGEAATYLSPHAKEWIVGIGVFSTLGIRIIGAILKSHERAQFVETLNDQNIKTK